MKFGIKNLGPIKDANLEIGNLTIVCGKNNVGKTYYTYALYSFLTTIKDIFIIDFEENLFDTCIKTGECVFNFEKVKSHFLFYLNKYNKFFAKIVPFYLALNPQKTTATIDISSELEECEYNIFKNRIVSERRQATEKCYFDIEKADNSFDIRVRIINMGEALPERSILRPLFDNICSNVLNEIFPDAFSLTGERTGLSIFATDMARFSEKSPEVKPLPKNEEPVSIEDFEKKQLTIFPLPILKELEFFQQFKLVQRKVSFIAKNHSHILHYMNQISGGHYSYEEQLGIQFVPEQSSNPLSLYKSSSSVRSLVEFYFYLKHCAKEKQILMIDEPELNLHPQNQRFIARLLAKLVNAGVRVFITTHSDYIIREFNTLIALKQDKPHLLKIKNEEGYSDDELLDASGIRAYIARRNPDGVTFNPTTVTQDGGIDIPTLDEVIDKMNQIQDAIIWGTE